MKISTLGFPQAEESKLGKILPLAKNQSYNLLPFGGATLPDVLLVFGDAANYTAELEHLPDGHPIKIVIVAKQPPEQGDYHHLPFPLVASRVLRVLDNLSAPMATVVPQGLPGLADTEIKDPEAKPTASAIAVSVDGAPIPIGEDANVGVPQYRVLVVDDSLPMQKALALELEKLAATVHLDFAGSGEEALEKTAGKTYDFIFLDIMMPGIDGFETCGLMRKRADMKKVPIIMLSAKTSPMDEVKGVISGCTTYLAKPIIQEDFQKVMLRITKWVDNFNARGQDG